MGRAIVQLLRRLFTKKPTPEVKKPIVKKHHPTKQPTQAATDQKQDRYWRDRLASEDQKRSDFYERYRARLEDQSHDLGQDR